MPSPLVAVPPVTLIGFPYGSTGRSEHLRAVWRALETAGIVASIYDIPRGTRPSDPAIRKFWEHGVQELGPGIRLFHLNGHETMRALRVIGQRQPGFFKAGHNIIFPAWELPRYPARWARLLEFFHEVWTASAFVDRAVREVVRVPVFHIRNACQPHLATVFGRSHFGLPEDRFLVLFSFDLWSFASRKNPQAAIETFRRLLALRPGTPVDLVLKANHPAAAPHVGAEMRQAIADFRDRVTLVEKEITLDEARSLIRCADCYLSLHRSEGFGRGPAEAMFFGKPVVATGWSGNMEYMNAEVSFPVGYRLVPVEEGQYLEAHDQVWAEPDVDEAASILARLVDDPELGRAVGARARAHMELNFSDEVLGRRYRDRFTAIAAARAGGS